MKRILCIILLVVALGNSARSCDLCGCSAGNQYIGLLPNQYKHFVGLQYHYSAFKADQKSYFDEYEQAFASINTYQLWGRFSVGKKVQVFAFVPYYQNRGNEVGQPIKIDGIGDMSVLANVLVFKMDSFGTSTKHTLYMGGGIKAPTGKNTSVRTLDELGLPNIQTGTGSWDFIATTNYTLSKDKFGVNLDASYTLTTTSKDDYKYGNRLSANLLGFYRATDKKILFVPQAGFKYEYTLHNYDNYNRKWLNPNSGGNIFFAAAGVQAFYKHVGARLLYAAPISQNYAHGHVTTYNRLETSIYFLF